MSPPSFTDIGKSARDLLKKNFGLGISFMSFKGSHGAAEFTSRIDNVLRAQRVVGSVESKYEIKDYGLTLTEKWTSKDLISAQACFKDRPIDGLKSTVKMSYDAKSGNARTNVNGDYKRDAVHVTADFNLQKQGFPQITPSLVLGYQDYLVGVCMDLDVANQKINRSDFAVAYEAKDFGFHGVISHWGQTYTAGVFQRLTDRSEYAAEASWSRDAPDHHWTVAYKYALDPEKRHSLKVKLDNLQRISVALTCSVVDGVKSTVCAMLNDADQMPVGFGLEIER